MATLNQRINAKIARGRRREEAISGILDAQALVEDAIQNRKVSSWLNEALMFAQAWARGWGVGLHE
jgi:hypothetical protein